MFEVDAKDDGQGSLDAVEESAGKTDDVPSADCDIGLWDHYAYGGQIWKETYIRSIAPSWSVMLCTSACMAFMPLWTSAKLHLLCNGGYSG